MTNMPVTTDARVTLLTRTNCHLCDIARTTVRDVCRDTRTRWTEVDVDTDPELRSEYGDQVPVVLVDDEEIATLGIEPISLQQALDR